jgi:Holliday junction resolvasome RuvABC endonuclease subunit
MLMKICSLDLSSKASGYAIIENRTLIDSGVVTASGTDAIARIKKMSGQIASILAKHKDIDVLVMEEVRPADDNGNRKNLHTHKILMYVQAAMVFLMHELYSNIQIEYLYPSEWRAECGIPNGRGIYREQQKQMDIAFVKQLFNLDVSDDEADAIGIGVAYAKKHDK